ncbi:flagellar hook-length control protein FliK, partial [Bordetella petrii]|uniref:flagellar hook-length control protein FliK n=1 Tax=Bordetella petrii TaxID=94624 RepID=UPI001E56E0E4
PQAQQALAAAGMPAAPSTLESLASALPDADAAPPASLGHPQQAVADTPSGAHHDTVGALASALHGATGARQDASASFLLPPGSSPLTLGVATPVAATPAWGADLGRQLVVLSHDARQNLQTAELRLDPPDLGPLRVTLSVNDGVANASFVSAHAAVRHAVEAALPQLQQALAQAGLSLGQANVGEHGAQSGFDMQQQGQGRGQGGGGSQPDHGTAVAQAVASTPRRGDGLVDTFA